MSRIGKQPVSIPAGVTVDVKGNVVHVKGPKGELTQEMHKDMQIALEDGHVVVRRPSEDKLHKSLHGLTRTLIANMVEGVEKGYSKELEVNGVGYRVAKQGKQLVMNLGYSHQVIMDEIRRHYDRCARRPTRSSSRAPTSRRSASLPLKYVRRDRPNPIRAKALNMLPRSCAARKARPAVRRNKGGAHQWLRRSTKTLSA